MLTGQDHHTRVQNYKTTKTRTSRVSHKIALHLVSHHMNIALQWRKFCVCAEKHFHIMNIDVPADVGIPPLNTQLPHVLHQFLRTVACPFNGICPLVKPCNHPHCLTSPKILSHNVIHSSITHQPILVPRPFPF